MRILRLIFIWTFRVIKYTWLTVWTLYQIALGAILVGLVWLGFQGMKLYHYTHIEDVRALQSHPPRTTAFIEAERQALKDSLRIAQKHGSRVLPDTTIHWTWIPLDSIPRTLVDMVLVAEDSKFYSHEGFDLEQIEYALVSNHQAGHPMRGASTITQQVAKNLYLDGEKEMKRKLREASLVFLLEQYLTKDQILEIYLNIAQFGPGVFGVREGARHHFGKDISLLSPDEMLSLVCLLPSPERWNPKRSNPVYLSHRLRVLQNYALYRGIRSTADSTAPEWMRHVYDSLSNVLVEQRWKKLRSNSGVPLEIVGEPPVSSGNEAVGVDTSQVGNAGQ